MEEKMNTTKGKNKTLFIVLVILAIALAVASPWLPSLKWWESTEYCHYENEVTDELNRSECINMKIVSKTLNRVGFNNPNVTVTCYDTYEELPECEGDNYYISDYSLDLFTEKDIQGYICLSYYVKYHTLNSTKQDFYEKIIAEQIFNNSDDLEQAFIDCFGGY